MKVIFVLPTYNEAKIVENNTLKLLEYLKNNLKGYQWEILIADNGSNDNTVNIAKKLSDQYTEVNYFHIPQKGRGFALQKAWNEYQTDIFLYMDSDLATELAAIFPTVKAISEENFDIAIGSRHAKGAKIERSLFRDLVSRSLNIITKIIFKTKITDVQCGFKAVNQKIIRNILPKIEDTGWFFDTELLILAEKEGYRIKEIPVEWFENRFQARKSTVKIFSTILDDLKKMWQLRKRIIKMHEK